MPTIRKTLTALTVLGTASLGFAGLASAEEATTTTAAAPLAPVAPVATAAPSTTTLPLFGAPLIIDITVGPDGGLDAVSINPSTDPAASTATAAAPWTADKVKPNKVSFINDAGTVRVVVKANDGGQRVAVKAAALADITGAGEWKGDVFDDGAVSSVKYTVGGTPEAPTITIGDIAVTAPIVATPIASKVSTDDDDDDGEISVRAGVKFTNGNSTRTLTVSVEVHQVVETDDDDSHEGAQLRVTLGRIRTKALLGADAVGAHTWNGTLCDATKVAVTYDVAPDGTVTVAPTPGQTVETKHNGARVTFTDGSRLSIKVQGSDDDENEGQLRLREQFKIRCERENPVLNVPTSTTDGRDKHEDDDDHSEDRKGREERSSEKSSTNTTRSSERSTSTTRSDHDDEDDKSGKGNDD